MNTVSSTNRTLHPLPVVIVFGPTAVGKTDLLLSLFTKNAEVINADSMQIYRKLDIGTAKPSPAVRNELPHHLIDIRNPDEQFSAGNFVRAADKLIAEIWDRGKIPVISGGTAFYFRNFLYGLPEAPAAYPDIRRDVQKSVETHGIAHAYELLSHVDPVSASRISINDRYRIERALEVFQGSGRPLSSFELPHIYRDKFKMLLFGLNRPRQKLYDRIDRRVDMMFLNGLETEVASLISEGYTSTDPGMRGIGYHEFMTMRREGCISISDIKDKIKKNSRNYAKRQLTFFRSFHAVHWIHPDESSELSSMIERFLHNGVD